MTDKVGTHDAFLVSGGSISHTCARYCAVLDLDDYAVLPASPVSPLELFVVNGRKRASRTGVVLLCHSPEEPVLVHAAKQAFFKLNLDQLMTVANERKLDIPGDSLPDTVTSLVKDVLEEHSERALSQEELHEILALRCCEETDLFKDVCDDDLLIDCLDKEEIKQLLDHQKQVERSNADTHAFRGALQRGEAGVAQRG